MTSQVHVEVVSVGPLQVGQHCYFLLYDLVLLGVLCQGLGGSLEVPHVDEAVQSTFGHNSPLTHHSQTVHDGILPLILVTLW